MELNDSNQVVMTIENFCSAGAWNCTKDLGDNVLETVLHIIFLITNFRFDIDDDNKN